MNAARWQLIALIAGRQHGIVTTQQLIDCGFSRRSISRAVAIGHLQRIHLGVYALGHRPTDPKAWKLAAVLACGSGAALSHRSLLEHHGTLRPQGGPISVTVPSRNDRRRPGIEIHRQVLPRPELAVVHGIPATTPSRALLDLAATRPWELERAIREAGGKGLLDIGELDGVIERHSGDRGVARLRSLVAGREPIPPFTRSELERRMHSLCRRHGIDLPEMNALILCQDEQFEVDCVWFRERLAIECDSRWHDNPVSATRDAMHDQLLTLDRWRVHRLRWAQVVQAPARTAATIQRLLTDQRRLREL